MSEWRIERISAAQCVFKRSAISHIVFFVLHSNGTRLEFTASTYEKRQKQLEKIKTNMHTSMRGRKKKHNANISTRREKGVA